MGRKRAPLGGQARWGGRLPQLSPGFPCRSRPLFGADARSWRAARGSPPGRRRLCGPLAPAPLVGAGVHDGEQVDGYGEATPFTHPARVPCCGVEEPAARQLYRRLPSPHPAPGRDGTVPAAGRGEAPDEQWRGRQRSVSLLRSGAVPVGDGLETGRGGRYSASAGCIRHLPPRGMGAGESR